MKELIPAKISARGQHLTEPFLPQESKEKCVCIWRVFSSQGGYYHHSDGIIDLTIIGNAFHDAIQ